MALTLEEHFNTLSVQATSGNSTTNLPTRPRSPGSLQQRTVIQIPNSRAEAYSWGRLSYPKEMIKSIERLIGHNAKALDVGCGPGTGTLEMREFCTKHIIGFDIDKSMLDELAKSSVDAGHRIPTRQGRVQDLLTVFPRKRFDAIIAFRALTLFYDEDSLQAIGSCLKQPHGLLIDAGDEDPDNDEMMKMMEAVFQKACVGFDPSYYQEQEEKTKTGSKKVDEAQEALKRNGFEIHKVRDRRTGKERLCIEKFSQVDRYTMQAALANFKSRRAYPKDCSEAVEKRIVESLREHYRTELRSDIKKVEVAFKYTAYTFKPKEPQILLSKL